MNSCCLLFFTVHHPVSHMKHDTFPLSFQCRCDFYFETLRIYFPPSFFFINHYYFNILSIRRNCRFVPGISLLTPRVWMWRCAGERLGPGRRRGAFVEPEREGARVYYLDDCTAEEGERLNISVSDRGSH